MPPDLKLKLALEFVHNLRGKTPEEVQAPIEKQVGQLLLDFFVQYGVSSNKSTPPETMMLMGYLIRLNEEQQLKQWKTPVTQA